MTEPVRYEAEQLRPAECMFSELRRGGWIWCVALGRRCALDIGRGGFLLRSDDCPLDAGGVLVVAKEVHRAADQ